MNHAFFTRIACLAIIMTVLLSSCELQKRRYSGGYYINLQKNKAQTPVSASNPQIHTESKHNPEKETSTADSTTEILHASIAKKNDLILSQPTKDHSAGAEHNTIIPTERHASGNVSSTKDTKTSRRVTTQEIKHAKKIKHQASVEKKHLKDDIDQKRKRRTALIIGISLLLMAAVAAFAAPAIGGVFVLAEPVLTALNITGALGKFWGIIAGWVVIFILDILVSLGVYKYYKDEKPKLALTNGILRLVYSAMLGVGIAQLFRAAISAPNSAIYGLLSSFHDFWNWGLIVFGLHLIALGILYNNEGGKKWVNISIKALLIIAGLGYMILNIGILISPNPAAFRALIEPIFLAPQILGEVLFALWMLIKGGKKSNKTASTETK